MPIVEIITLITVVIDFISTIIFAILTGNCKSACCYGLCTVEHQEEEETEP